MGIKKNDKNFHLKFIAYRWASLVVQWLRLHALNAGDTGSNPGRGTKIPQCIEHGQNKIKIHTLKKIYSIQVNST